MASDFDRTFDFLVKSNVEGITSELKDDAGGLTKYGISNRSYPNIDIANLTRDDAKRLYKRDWWDSEYNFIQNQDVANKIFLAAINLGTKAAHSILQEVLNEMGNNLKVDGNFGPKTLFVVNSINPEILIDKYTIGLIKHYLSIDDDRIERKRTSYLRSWVRRALV